MTCKFAVSILLLPLLDHVFYMVPLDFSCFHFPSTPFFVKFAEPASWHRYTAVRQNVKEIVTLCFSCEFYHWLICVYSKDVSWEQNTGAKMAPIRICQLVKLLLSTSMLYDPLNMCSSICAVGPTCKFSTLWWCHGFSNRFSWPRQILWI